MGRLQGKVAIVTGAASGMGEAAAILFAREGANVVLADLNTTGGEAAAARASEGGARCVFQHTDVTAESGIVDLIARATAEFGRLDILYNNAGVGGAVGPIEHIDADHWDRTQAVLLRGAMLGIKHAVPALRLAGGGAILSTTSISAFYAYPTLHAYGAAKAGLINLTRSAAIQLGGDNIRVNCISPGNIVTPMIGSVQGLDRATVEAKFATTQPIRRAGQPADIAEAALFLVSDAAGFVTGHNLIVDGGLTLGMGPRSPLPDPSQPQTRGGYVGPSFTP